MTETHTQPDLRKRRLSIVGAILFLVMGVMGFKFLSSQKEPPPREEQTEVVKAVKMEVIENNTIATTIEVQGELMAYNKIDLFSEVNGTLKSSSRPFKVGTYFPKGSLLAKIDDTEARLGLQAQKSTLINAIAQMLPDLKIDYPQSFPQWESYLTAFDVNEGIKPLPEAASEREKLFIATRNIQTQYFNIKSTEERLIKYNIYSPFGGVITAANTNTGAVVRAGQNLGQLMATGQYELVATVLLSELSYIKTGNKVNLVSNDINGEWKGTVKRISDQIDPASQTVKVFISVNGEGLREGMYLSGQVASGIIENVVEIDRALLLSQNEVYVVINDELQLRSVQVIKMKRNTVIIQGLENGTTILAQPIADAHIGMAVTVVK